MPLRTLQDFTDRIRQVFKQVIPEGPPKEGPYTTVCLKRIDSKRTRAEMQSGTFTMFFKLPAPALQRRRWNELAELLTQPTTNGALSPVVAR